CARRRAAGHAARQAGRILDRLRARLFAAADVLGDGLGLVAASARACREGNSFAGHTGGSSVVVPVLRGADVLRRANRLRRRERYRRRRRVPVLDSLGRSDIFLGADRLGRWIPGLALLPVLRLALPGRRVRRPRRWLAQQAELS